MAIKSEIPQCGYREEYSEIHFKCHHKDMIAKDGLVPKKVCEFCTLHSRVVNGEKWREVAEEGNHTVVLKGPGALRMGWNLTKALAKYVANGMRNVTEDEYKQRLEICDTCPLRQGERCTSKACGCVLSRKAMMASEHCPEGKW